MSSRLFNIVQAYEIAFLIEPGRSKSFLSCKEWCNHWLSMRVVLCVSLFFGNCLSDQHQCQKISKIVNSWGTYSEIGEESVIRNIGCPINP